MRNRLQNVRSRARTRQRLQVGALWLRSITVFAIGSAWRILPYLFVAAFVMAVPVLGVQAYRYMVTSDHFSLQNLVIEGNKRLHDDDVRALANIGEGLNLLVLEEDIVKADIEQHPWVRRADIDIELPERLRIRIIEREAAALVALGALYLADDRGVVFKRWEPGDPLEGLPIITGVDRDSLVTDGTVEGAEQVIRDAVQLANTYSRHAVSKVLPLGEIHHDRLMGWKIATVDAMEIQLGVGDISAKLDRLLRVVSDLSYRGNTADVVRLDDAVDPSRVTVRIRTSSESSMGSPGQPDSQHKQETKGNAKVSADKAAGVQKPEEQSATEVTEPEPDGLFDRIKRHQILP